MSIRINNGLTNAESKTLDYQKRYATTTWVKASAWFQERRFAVTEYIAIKSYMPQLANSKRTDTYSSNVLKNANYDISNMTDALKSAKNTLFEEENDISIIPVPEFVWDLAQTFLTSYAKWINTHYEILIDAPDISPLPNGSLDILWYNKKGKILINIDNSSDVKAYYYSDFHNRKNPMKGNVEINSEIDESLAIRIKKLLTDD